MKRCIICGSPYDESSTVCEICGTPYIDIPDLVNEQDDVFVESSTPEMQDEQDDDFTEEGSVDLAEESVPEEEEEPEEKEELVEGPQREQLKETSGQRISPEQEKPEVQPKPDVHADSEEMTDKGRRYDQGARPQSEIVYDRKVQPVRPQGGAIYGQNGQPARPQGGAIYGQNGQPVRSQGGMVYGQNARPVRPQGRNVYGQNGQGDRPQGRPPYGQNGQPVRPQGRPPYDPDMRGGRPQGRPPYDPNRQGRQPVRTPYMAAQGRPNAGMPRQGTYGQRMLQESRKLLHSPLFLMLTILYTAAIIASAVSSFMQNLNFSQILQMLTNVDAPGELMAYVEKVVDLFSKFDNGAFMIVLVSKIPDVFLCLGFWIAFLTSGKRREKVSGGGFLSARIGLILKLITGCVLMLVCLLLAVTFVVSAWVSGIQTAKVASVIFLAAMIILTMIIVMYFFCCLHTIKVCESNMARGEACGKASMYAAVLTMLGSLFSVIMLLSSVVNMEIAGIVSAACSIGWMILMGLWILGYRSKVNGGKRK